MGGRSSEATVSWAANEELGDSATISSPWAAPLMMTVISVLPSHPLTPLSSPRRMKWGRVLQPGTLLDVREVETSRPPGSPPLGRSLRKAHRAGKEGGRRFSVRQHGLHRGSWVHPEGLQAGSSDASRAATAAPPRAQVRGLQPLLPDVRPPRSSARPCIVFLPQHVSESPSGPVASLEMTSVVKNICSFWLFKQCPRFARGKGKETL